MGHKKLFLLQPLVRSLVPLTIGTSCYLLKELYFNLFHEKSAINFLNLSTMKQEFSETQQIGEGSLLRIIIECLTWFQQVSFGAYKNIFAFFFAMFFLEVMIRKATQWASNQTKLPISNEEIALRRSFSEERGKSLDMVTLKNFSMIIFCYALIFFAFKTIGTSFVHRDLQINSSPILTTEDFYETLRILEQEAVFHEDPLSILSPPLAKSSEKISLSMGNTMSSLNLDVTAMVLSKDKKTAFVTINYYGTLKIIDLSDLQAPAIISSLSLQVSGMTFRIKALALSSDEKTLYISNFRDLEIVDITNLDSPQLLSLTENGILTDYDAGQVTRLTQTSLALDEKTKTLFIGGLGFQVFDVSNPQKPVVLRNEKNLLDKEKKHSRMDVHLSHDKEVLFVANGTLDVYNISNPKDLKVIRSFQTESSARSIYFPQDSETKTTFLVGAAANQNIILEEVDISNYGKNKTTFAHRAFHLGFNSTFPAHILAISPCRTKFFIFVDHDIHGFDLLIFDSVKNTAISNKKNLINDTYTMNFLPDGKTLLTGSNEQFMIIELFLDYPNQKIFSQSLNNPIVNFSLDSSCRKIHLSADGKSLYVVRKDDDGISVNTMSDIFEIYDLSGKISILSGTYKTDQQVNQMFLSKYSPNRVYLVGRKKILSLDVTNKSSPYLKNVFQPKITMPMPQEYKQLEILPGGKTALVLHHDIYYSYITLFSFSEDSRYLGSIDDNLTVFTTQMILKDEQTLIVLDNKILIYNISDARSPVKIATLPLGINEHDPYISSYLLSPDNKTLFLEVYDQNEFFKLQIYDLSNVSSPKFVSEQELSKHSLENAKPRFSLSSDLKTGFVYQDFALLRINLTNLQKPRVSGMIPLTAGNKPVEMNFYFFSPDDSLLFTVTETNQIKIYESKIKYSLYLKQENFLLGEKYSYQVEMLSLNNGEGAYEVMDKNDYRIVKLSLFDMKIVPNKYLLELKTSILPSWMSFDGQSNSLTLESKKQYDLGEYTFHSAFSLKIPTDVFDNIGVNVTGFTSENLFAWLISLGYIDNEYFLTSNLGAIENFLLPTPFNSSKAQIYNTLKQYYIETCTGFEIWPSLELKQNQTKMMISTPSLNHIKVEIKLDPGLNARFLNKPYGSLLPVITDEKTKLSLDGALKEINSVIQSIVINFEGENTILNANVTISDGLNPIVTERLNNISKYFKSNKPPGLNNQLNKTVQEQIDSTYLWTGEFFTIVFDKETFKDDYSETLGYEIAMVKYGTDLPNWLSFSGLTLRGTPPEEILGRNIDLYLIAKNEFKQLKVPFKLHINVSSVFLLKLALRYSPYILTILGLLVSANKIFNILGKKTYKHKKEYVLSPGEEINSGVIYPIFFVKQEMGESNLIFKHLRRFVEKESPMIDYFTDTESNQLDKERIIETIQETVAGFTVSEKKKLKFYCSSIILRKQLIQQLIINQIILLKMNQYREIKLLFDQIKDEWIEIVYWDVQNSKFSLNKNKLEKIIREKSEITRTMMEQSESLLLNEINVDLLEDCILVYAFEQHQIKRYPVQVEISMKQQMSSNPLFKFLKFDLKNLSIGENKKMDYGINYRIKDNILSFYGVAEDYLEGEALVLQIATTRHKIIKEIWIRGNSEALKNGEGDKRSESIERGRGYEVF